MEFKEALVYASNNIENNCWQIKTFMDDHTSVRETKNKLTNRKWLACKLVKKLRKYPNLGHSETAQYFKTKYDLDLNKNCAKKAVDEEAAAAQPTATNGGEGQVNSALVGPVNGGKATPVPQPPTEIQLELISPSSVRPLKFPPKRKLSKQKKSTLESSNLSATTPPAVTPSASSQSARNHPPNPMQDTIDHVAYPILREEQLL
ncbi:hypothetical protein Ahy_B06g085132 isoform A [Arachis hypogaea]|uniref:Uncharacterized protein n=1 Tax=Arachis hypogaea TaxID=3818 RepID=A0A444YTK9_ARAHY|nr:hypothetical protein Ahy_B06g085132 isoform A [Arachis hypogaea]